MEETLKSNEENTGDTVEGKTENSEDSEVSCYSVFILLKSNWGEKEGGNRDLHVPVLSELKEISLYLFIYLFTNFAKDNLAGEISQNYCSNNETPKQGGKKRKKNKTVN